MSSALPLKGCKVLVVDDDPVIRVLLFTQIGRAGGEVGACGSGEESIDLLRTPGNDFDVVVLDLMLPGMSGLRTVEVIRRAGFDGGIVGMSAHVTPEISRYWLDVGCDTVLSKDSPRSLLLASIIEACSIAGDRRSSPVA